MAGKRDVLTRAFVALAVVLAPTAAPQYLRADGDERWEPGRFVLRGWPR